jgi:hypothetical protein
VRHAGGNDHTSAAPGQPFPQEHRQQEGRQVIDLKGQLMPVARSKKVTLTAKAKRIVGRLAAEWRATEGAIDEIEAEILIR